MNDELAQILNEVRRLYEKYGIKSVTMDDVARQLGISKKTLYQYVEDKSDLVSKVLDFSMECHEHLMNDDIRSKLNAIEELFWVNKKVNRLLKDHNPSMDYDLKKYYPALHQKFHSVKRERMYANILANINKGKEEGLYRQEVDAEVISKLYLTRIENIPNEGIFSVEEFTSPKFFREIFIYHIRGIANDKGIKFLEKNLNKLTIEE